MAPITPRGWNSTLAVLWSIDLPVDLRFIVITIIVPIFSLDLPVGEHYSGKSRQISQFPNAKSLKTNKYYFLEDKNFWILIQPSCLWLNHALIMKTSENTAKYFMNNTKKATLKKSIEMILDRHKILRSYSDSIQQKLVCIR